MESIFLSWSIHLYSAWESWRWGGASNAIITGLHLNSTSAQLTVALLTGFILGTPIGVVYHLEAPGYGGEASYVFLALKVITITTGIVFLGIVFLKAVKKYRGAGKGDTVD